MDNVYAELSYLWALSVCERDSVGDVDYAGLVWDIYWSGK
jgi:hypothetical protein